MRNAGRIFLLLTLAVLTILLASCGQKQNCSGITFGGTGGTGSGSSGGLNSGGTSCGPGQTGGGGNASDFVFYRGSNGSNNAVNTAELTATAFQNLAGVSSVVGNSTTGNMVVVNKAFLYLPDQNSTGGVMAFAINRSTGALTAINGSPFSAPHPVTALAADPDATGGRFLFAGDITSGDVSVYTIDPTTGALGLASGSTFSGVAAGLSALEADGTGTYLYATSGTTNGLVYGFSFDQTSGALSPVPGSPFAADAVGIQVSPDGNWVIAHGGGTTLNVIPVEQGTGALLVPLATSYPTVNAISQVVMHPNGTLVYTCDTKKPMEGFSFSNGTLTALTGSPYTALNPISYCQFDQTGTALFGLFLPSSVMTVRIIDPATGNVSGGIPDLGIQTGPNFGVTK